VAVATNKSDDGLARFVLLALVATPVSIATALWLTHNVWLTHRAVALGVFIFFVLPGLITLALGALLRQGLVRTFGVAFCIDVLGGRLTLIAFGVLLDRSGALS
jgi:hypothetical protein